MGAKLICLLFGSYKKSLGHREGLQGCAHTQQSQGEKPPQKLTPGTLISDFPPPDWSEYFSVG